MRALQAVSYGPPSELRMTELPTPHPAAGEVRIRVHAASLNAYDWHLYRGDPWLARMAFGVRRPRPRTLGLDCSGVVDALGEGVDGFAIGDRVAAATESGTFAESAVVKADAVARIPDGVGFEQAAALPGAGLTAFQGLRGAGVKAGDRVLVIGASGGVGHFAAQFARAFDASRVVAVCSGRNARMLADLGADRVIDYTRERVTDAGERFDVVFDTVGTTSFRRLTRVMERGAVYAPAGGLGGGPLLGPMWAIYSGVPASWFLPQRVAPVSAKLDGGDLARMLALVADGSVRPVIEQVHGFDDYESALTALEAGHVAGKRVLRVGD